MATKSKNRKNHKQKVANRNQRLKERKSRMDKMQREFIMNLIKQEQEKGLYDQSKPIDGPVIDGPILDGPMLDGPMLDGPILDGPILDGPILDGPITEVVDVTNEAEENSTEN